VKGGEGKEGPREGVGKGRKRGEGKDLPHQ